MERRRISLELSEAMLQIVDRFKSEYGLRSRGAIVERLLLELLPADELEAESQAVGYGTSHPTYPDPQKVQTQGESAPSAFNEGGSLVLVARGTGGSLALDVEAEGFDLNRERRSAKDQRGGGIDLPGFVRKQSADLKRSLNPTRKSKVTAFEPMPMASCETIDRAFEKVRTHWIELYGHTANDAVLEAAMTWLAHDIWPTSDQSEGRPFTWSMATSVTGELAQGWPEGPASFERVMVVAGILEDPFSTSTLELRLPTLIRRFVNRFRKRNQTTSFEALEHTMTLHGALKLLNLPTAPGHRLTLVQIREGYRDRALLMHPDAGGSEEGMRKVNEAYQLLKELYRRH